jgi:type I restriction enzyme S subunit
LTIAANIGDVGILEFDSAFPDSLVGITPTDHVTSQFLCLYLLGQKSEMDRLAPRGTQKNINIRFLEPWPVPVPPPKEQMTIQMWLQAVNCKLEGEERRKQALEILVATLVHNLITGEIRLPGFPSGKA